MSRSTQWILQVGTQTLLAAHLQCPAKGKPFIDNFLSSEITWDRRSPESLATATVEVFSRLRPSLGGTRSIALIPTGFSGLAKFLEVPSVEKSRRPDALRQAAANNLPYALDSVFHGTQVLNDDGIEMNLLLAAAPREGLEKLIEELGQTGGFSVQFLGSPALLELAALEALATPTADASEPAARGLLHIGERTAHLILTHRNAKFIRVFNLGAELLLQGLSDSLGFSPNEAARLLEKLLHGDLPDNTNPHAAHVRSQTAAWIDKIQREVARTLATTRRQSPDLIPNALLLAGAFGRLPELSLAFSPKLFAKSTPVDPLPLLTCVSPEIANQIRSRSTELQAVAGYVHFASASQARGDGSAILNLLPSSVAARHQFTRRKPWILGAAASLAAASLLYAYGTHAQRTDLIKTTRQLQAATAPLRSLSTAIAEEKQGALAAQQAIARLENVLNSRYNWINFFVDLQERLVTVEDVWLENLEILPAQETTNSPEKPDAQTLAALEDAPAAWEDLETPTPSAHPSPPAPVIRLRLTGRIVDRANPLDKASPQMRERVNSLLDAFRESDFINAVDNPKFDTTVNGILGFEFDLRLNPNRPL